MNAPGPPPQTAQREPGAQPRGPAGTAQPDPATCPPRPPPPVARWAPTGSDRPPTPGTRGHRERASESADQHAPRAPPLPSPRARHPRPPPARAHPSPAPCPAHPCQPQHARACHAPRHPGTPGRGPHRPRAPGRHAPAQRAPGRPRPRRGTVERARPRTRKWTGPGEGRPPPARPPHAPRHPGGSTSRARRRTPRPPRGICVWGFVGPIWRITQRGSPVGRITSMGWLMSGARAGCRVAGRRGWRAVEEGVVCCAPECRRVRGSVGRPRLDVMRKRVRRPVVDVTMPFAVWMGLPLQAREDVMWGLMRRLDTTGAVQVAVRLEEGPGRDRTMTATMEAVRSA